MNDKKTLLEKLLNESKTSIGVAVRRAGVVVPHKLKVDAPACRFDLSWKFGAPMEISTWGVKATLTFNGVPFNCSFPWDAIFLMQSNASTHGWQESIPTEAEIMEVPRLAPAGLRLVKN